MSGRIGWCLAEANACTAQDFFRVLKRHAFELPILGLDQNRGGETAVAGFKEVEHTTFESVEGKLFGDVKEVATEAGGAAGGIELARPFTPNGVPLGDILLALRLEHLIEIETGPLPRENLLENFGVLCAMHHKLFHRSLEHELASEVHPALLDRSLVAFQRSASSREPKEEWLKVEQRWMRAIDAESIKPVPVIDAVLVRDRELFLGRTTER